MRSASLRVLALASVAALAACESASPGSAVKIVSLSFAGVQPAAVVAAPRMAAVVSGADTLVQTSGSDTLKITGAWVVLRRVSLERVEGSTSNCDTMPDNSPLCEDFSLRDLLVTLPLVAGVQTALAIQVDTGQYGSVHFKIHKPGNDSIDAAFKTANPGFDTVSVKVTGLFDGTPFTFVSRLDAEQEYDFNPPLVVNTNGVATNLTIRMDLTTWFLNGTALVSPSTANPGGPNEGLVTQNIRNSVKAFEDRSENDTENH